MQPKCFSASPRASRHRAASSRRASSANFARGTFREHVLPFAHRFVRLSRGAGEPSRGRLGVQSVPFSSSSSRSTPTWTSGLSPACPPRGALPPGRVCRASRSSGSCCRERGSSARTRPFSCSLILSPPAVTAAIVDLAHSRLAPARTFSPSERPVRSAPQAAPNALRHRGFGISAEDPTSQRSSNRTCGPPVKGYDPMVCTGPNPSRTHQGRKGSTSLDCSFRRY